ncbi:hypothetical protein SYNPS1DRAFT_28158 [Syncephalis pseudoplumigaleata]|uniref:Uncharacterized protein n=1 Tax=Syncephalis pseudoplumigaleata TaxID=1712513 RepID=A0A4P9Z1E6_9FUNG|nr:hypothetical protein SYNPS1DRAFT_28158 [Syncephalis pseudoplumigaleata]|eukprot:RKP26135.1 hypothetical protein SYNPS1DRAFT_28158 [Syncephalis pseudoplumigaleata]
MNDVSAITTEKRKRGRPRKEKKPDSVTKPSDENAHDANPFVHDWPQADKDTAADHYSVKKKKPAAAAAKASKASHADEMHGLELTSPSPVVANQPEELNIDQPAPTDAKSARPKAKRKPRKGGTAQQTKPANEPHIPAVTAVAASDAMDVSFDDVDLNRPWLAMGIDELRQSYGKLHARHVKLRELRETDAERLLQRYKTAMEAEMAAMNDQLQALQAENQQLKQMGGGAVTNGSKQAQHRASDKASLEKDKQGKWAGSMEDIALCLKELRKELEQAKEREKDYIEQLEQLQSSELLELYTKLTGATITRLQAEDAKEIIFDFVHEGRNGGK